MARFDQAFQTGTGKAIKKTERHPRQETVFLHYSKLIDNKAQYCNEKSRDEIEALADLIEADGRILQNILVRKSDTDEYELIAGHKRRRAAKLLVEERGQEQFAFVPCMIENISDVRAEFQVYSSNGHHPKNDYERMHELERMKYLLETYPEEFPEHLQRGRMVERLARQMGMKRTTVGEYLAIARNLGGRGMEEFKNGFIKKSAAVEMASLPEEEQEKLIEQGATSLKEVQAYKEQKKTRQNQESEHTVSEHPEPEQAKPDYLEPERPEPGLLRPEQAPEPESQLAGQYGIINTAMDIAEEPAETAPAPEQELEAPPMQAGNAAPSKEADEMAPPRILPHLKNDDQRKEWLQDYKSWGVWYRDDNIGVEYYKYEFPDGTRLIAETYPHNKETAPGQADYIPYYLHLVGGPKEREKNQYGQPKYPYHEHYSRYPESERELIEFLKAVQRKCNDSLPGAVRLPEDCII